MIVGAGLAGLIAAQVFPRQEIHDASPEPSAGHKALLRFRSEAVSDLTGIDFRRVRVRKGIWSGNKFRAPDVRLANLYTQKCLGRIVGDRSIWSLDPVDRWIAPEDFYDQLIESAGRRIHWGSAFNFEPECGNAMSEPLISTAPMPMVLKALGMEAPTTFEKSPIHVERYRVPRTDAHQTVYFPDEYLSVYRASITGDLLIVEHAGEPDDFMSIDAVMSAMALPADIEPLESVEQRYGKIAPIDAQVRKAIIARLTSDHGVFSLGRFATWRNILLDDVVQDAAVIKRLINATQYERRLSAL